MRRGIQSAESRLSILSLASNQRVRLQTLQEVQGMIEGVYVTKPNSADKDEHFRYQIKKDITEEVKLALSANLSALIEQENK